MLTEIWESDPFTEKKQSLIDTLDTDYRWQKGDSLLVTRGGGHNRFHVLLERVELSDDGIKRQILALRLT